MLCRTIWKWGTASLLTAFLCGQLTSSAQAFDAASVKRAEPPEAGGGEQRVRTKTGRETNRGGPDTSDPGRIHDPRITLKALLMRAYDVRDWSCSVKPHCDTH
jgi:uncharacterized protein (TIGR03435 family)